MQENIRNCHELLLKEIKGSGHHGHISNFPGGHQKIDFGTLNVFQVYYYLHLSPGYGTPQMLLVFYLVFYLHFESTMFLSSFGGPLN